MHWGGEVTLFGVLVVVCNSLLIGSHIGLLGLGLRGDLPRDDGRGVPIESPAAGRFEQGCEAELRTIIDLQVRLDWWRSLAALLSVLLGLLVVVLLVFGASVLCVARCCSPRAVSSTSGGKGMGSAGVWLTG